MSIVMSGKVYSYTFPLLLLILTSETHLGASECMLWSWSHNHPHKGSRIPLHLGSLIIFVFWMLYHDFAGILNHLCHSAALDLKENRKIQRGKQPVASVVHCTDYVLNLIYNVRFSLKFTLIF